MPVMEQTIEVDPNLDTRREGIRNSINVILQASQWSTSPCMKPTKTLCLISKYEQWCVR